MDLRTASAPANLRRLKTNESFMKAINRKMQVIVVISLGLFAGLVSIRAGAEPPSEITNTNEYSPSTNNTELDACKENLKKINAAIQAYRKDHGDVPNWLSDLVPKYLHDTNALICPVTIRTGGQSPFGVLDPNIYSSYLYEFAPIPIPKVVKDAFSGPEMSMRDWKRQQMNLAGSEVPLVRCLLHEPALNLSIGGKVYESEVYWELMFTNKADLKAFMPHK